VRRRTIPTTSVLKRTEPRAALLPANVLQCLFAQNIGVALTGFSEIDDLAGDGLLDEIVGAFGPYGDADHLECETEDASGLWIEVPSSAGVCPVDDSYRDYDA
jgi:hypothetical protein